MPLISIAEAFSLILEKTARAPVAHVPLIGAGGAGGALGHYLAADIRADRDLPPFNRSMVDGFAVFSADTRAAPDVLELIEEVPAGKSAACALSPGQTIKIMTGAPIPPGADAVLMQEHTEMPRAGFIKFLSSALPGQNVARKASDAKIGDVLIASGTRIGAAEIGVLAAVGCVNVPVRKLPSTVVLGTGDEIVEPHLEPGPAQIRNSNSYQLIAQCATHGIQARYLGLAPDQRAETVSLIAQGLESELFISTGGVSVGDHDHVGAAFKDLKVNIFFDKVAIKPGKPTTFGVKLRNDEGQTLVFGLPGNPVAAWVCFHLFVMTAVRVRCGAREPLPRWLSLPLLDGSGKSCDRTTFRPCKLVQHEGQTKVAPVAWHGSGHLSALVETDGLFVQPAGSESGAGERVTVYLV